MWRSEPTKKNEAIPKSHISRGIINLIMKNILFVLLITMPLLGFCQSLVFFPEIKTEERQILNDVDLSIVFKDSRTYKKKLKEKCTKTEIFTEFANCLRRTYPNMKITILEENQFEENPTKGNITLKIDLQKYDVTFYSEMYIAYTKYNVKIVDYRNGENIIEDTITMGEGKQLDELPYKSAEISSNRSFKQAFDRFTSMLDKHFHVG